MDRPVLIVVGGGAARRFGGDKLLARVNGRPVFVRALERLAPAAKRTVLVVPGGREAEFRALLDRYLPGIKIRCVPGGPTRPESVRAGCAASGMYAVGLAPTTSRLRSHTWTPQRSVPEKSRVGTVAVIR